MSIGIEVGYSWFQIGRSDYFDSFFSTIAYYLENQKWGSEFPVVMRKMYAGNLTPDEAKLAKDELLKIQEKLGTLKKEVSPIIWDARNLNLTPPEWAVNPNEHVQTLKNYFVISDGRDLLEILLIAVNKSIETNKNLHIKSLNEESTIYS
ncbi:Imm70 family immunity protein [Listeria sp. ILCC796]|uniref:Imm70 family immunity protein n=1 Tax=Listeria sp. ILCC796 TaxID=1918332 RepID=UPI000B594FAD|nr:Imm70 family immunity protein [Listeria sp. ILCC796]